MLYLLGDPHCVLEDGRQVHVPPTKPALLLCFLAVHGTWVSRAELALLLRPDAESSVALHAVRILLNRAKSLAWAAGLEVEGARVRFAPPTDVAAFQNACARGDWAAALSAYRQGLLAGYSLTGDDLGLRLLAERERLEANWLGAARALGAQREASGDFAGALEVWRACLARDPLAEDAVRGVMRSAHGLGQRATGVEAYRRFATLLKRELNAEPERATRDALQRLETSSPRGSESFAPGVGLRAAQLIGREAEGAQLRASGAAVVVVSGEPGVGKTRFLKEHLPPDTRWLRGVDGLHNVSFEPLLDYARTAVSPVTLEGLGAYRDDLARLLPELRPHSSSQSADLGDGKGRVLEAFARLLEAGGDVIAVDDLQWVDDATLECLTYILARGRVRLYATLRRDEVSPRLSQTLHAWNAQTIKLGAWTATSTARFVSSLIGAVPLEFSAWLHRATGGNAFFALEILKHLSETGRLPTDQTAWTAQDASGQGIPARLVDLVARRVARLPTPAQRVAQAAAVLGDAPDLEMLRALTGLSRAGVVDALEGLEAAQVLGARGFQHDLTRQAIYALLSATRRRALHEAAANLAGLDSARRADHALSAERPDVALPLLVDAGTRLLRRGLLSEAARSLERALGCQPDHAPTLALLAGIAMQTKDDAKAERLSQRLLGQPCDDLTRARALNVRAGLSYNAGRVEEAAPLIEEALRLAAPLERDDADLEETAFDILEAQGRYADAIAILKPAVARLRRFGDSGALSLCLSSLAALHDDTGQYALALTLHFEALEVARRAGSGYARVNASLQMLWGLNHAGRAEEAVRIAQDALSLGEYANTEYLRNGLGASLLHLGRVEEATQLYAHNAAHGQVTTRTLAWGRLASLHADAGRLSEARACATRALDSALGTQVFFARIRAAIAVLRYGTDEEVARVLPLVAGQRSPDLNAQAEFEAALEARGLRHVNP